MFVFVPARVNDGRQPVHPIHALNRETVVRNERARDAAKSICSKEARQLSLSIQRHLLTL